MKLFISILTLIITVTFGACDNSTDKAYNHNLSLVTVKSPVIYGEDTRVDLYELNSDKLIEKARASAILVPFDKLQRKNNDSMKVITRPIGEVMNLCENVRFRNQPYVNGCSAFLIAPNIIATAGHCTTKANFCDETAIVFDYSMTFPKDDPTIVSKSSIYRCNRILSFELDRRKKIDFALIELDRPVVDRSPLKYRRHGYIWSTALLTLIGNPIGLPTKISEGIDSMVRVTNDNLNVFVADLDSFHGNSGSAVLNSDTGKVEGILIRGEKDFVSTERGCQVPKVCKVGDSSDCRGEDVLRITTLLKHLPENLPSNIHEHITETFTVVEENGEPIPDNDKNGLTKSFHVDIPGKVLGATVEMTFEHAWPTDLHVFLYSPDGQRVDVTTRMPDQKEDGLFTIKFGHEGRYVKGFDKLWYQGSEGTWTLKIVDTEKGDTGTFYSAKLILNIADIRIIRPEINTPLPTIKPVDDLTPAPAPEPAPVVVTPPQDTSTQTCNNTMLRLCKIFGSSEGCETRWCK